MIIGFKYVNEEQENKDFYIFPVGRISTYRFLLQQGRFWSDISKSFLTISKVLEDRRSASLDFSKNS